MFAMPQPSENLTKSKLIIAILRRAFPHSSAIYEREYRSAEHFKAFRAWHPFNITEGRQGRVACCGAGAFSWEPRESRSS